MFTRTTARPEIPEREQMDLERSLCPPHDFEAAWATPPDAEGHDDTVPGLYCKSCGQVMPFRIPRELY